MTMSVSVAIDEEHKEHKDPNQKLDKWRRNWELMKGVVRVSVLLSDFTMLCNLASVRPFHSSATCWTL